jgi:DNA-binding CsgD family transcriptional regulator
MPTSNGLQEPFQGGGGKHHLQWEELDQLSDRNYTKEALKLAALFDSNSLTPTELRVCVLLRSIKSSVEIARVLNVEERSIETYRSRIHKKLGLEPHTHLLGYLLALKL